MTWSVPLFGYVTDLVSRGYLVFSVGVGVRASLAYSARCNMLSLLMYIDQQLRMYVSRYEMK